MSNKPRQIRGFVVVALIVIMFAAVFYFFFGDPTDPENINFDDSGPRIVALSALAFVFLASFIFGQPKIREIVQGTLFWGGLCALLVVGYTYRTDLVQAGYRVLGALAPGLAVTQPDGSILIVRDATGHFVLDGRVNGTRTHFLLDTGASAVVLTYDDARRAGFDPDTLSFTVPVSTANGRAMVAPILIETLTVGDHSLRNIRGFVARDGALSGNLFGLTALDKLRSWRIEGDRLIMNP
ncbi:MAG: TIGR02281 family clan AA aspartic protease [Pseudomonadota bacterium]